ncbi:MAG TPA: hypothetical protein VGD72_13565 [Mycobacteriales bacterium]
MNARPVTALLGAAALMLAPAACTGHTSSPAAPAASGSATAAIPWTSSSPANPNLPEVNAQGDIPDNQQYVAYSPPGSGYSVKVPEGWARTTGPSTATFTDKLNSIRVDVAGAATAPTPASVRAETAAYGRTAGHFAPGPVDTVQRKAGAAVVARYRADAAADPVTGKVVNDDVEKYEFWRNGKLVTLTLAGPHGADNVDPWRIVTDSFRWTA